MKGLYEEYFYVPKHGKVKEKVMLARIAVSVVVMLVLMAGMSLSAYAYFTANNTTMIKPIKAAHYQLDTVVIAPEGLTPDNVGVYTLNNSNGDEAKDFVFKFLINEATNATVGFCEIIVKTDASEDVQKFYTEPIGKYVIADQPLEVKERSITIRIPKGETADVRFVSQWGTCGVPAQVLTANEQDVVLLYDQVQYAQSAFEDSDDAPDNAGDVGSLDNNAEDVTQDSGTSENTETTSNQDAASDQETDATGNNE